MGIGTRGLRRFKRFAATSRTVAFERGLRAAYACLTVSDILAYESRGTADVHNPPLHRAAIATALLTFPLVWLGGLVTSHAAGMSVPDWPNSYGYNMFALPFSRWLGASAGGAFYEHTHRLLGTLVGLGAFTATMIAWGPSRLPIWRRRWGWTSIVCLALFVLSLGSARVVRAAGTITEKQYQLSTHLFSTFASVAIAAGIVWACRRRDPIRYRRWMVTSLLFAVIAQGLMGGFRVDEVSLLLAKMHGIFGQMTFAYAAVIATVCSTWWTDRRPMPSLAGAAMRRHVVIAVALIATQLTLGALMRHDPHREANAVRGDGSAGLAIPDWPLHYGHVLPPTNAAALSAVNEHRIWELNWPAVTMGQVWLHFGHRVGAYLTFLAVLAVVFIAIKRHRGERKIFVPSLIFGALVCVQVTLGVLTVLKRKPADIATMHQATGALLLMTAAVLLARTLRLYALRVAEVPAAVRRPAAPAAIDRPPTFAAPDLTR